MLYRNIALIGSLAASFISLGAFLYLSNMNVPEVNATVTDRNGPGQVVAGSRYLRLAIFVIANILISACAVFSVVNNNIGYNMIFYINDNFQFKISFTNEEPLIDFSMNLTSNNNTFNNSMDFNETFLSSAPIATHAWLDSDDYAPIFLYCCAISLAAVSAFLRSGFILKLGTMLLAIICQVIVLGYSDLFKRYNFVNEDYE